MLASDYAKAAGLFQADLAGHPGDAEIAAGLVHALLHQQKVQEAADAVKGSLAAVPNSAALITLRGEVELRQGMPWIAAHSANESLKLDPCNPRSHLLLADLERLSSLYASSRKELEIAYKLDREDPEINAEWISTLPLKEKIAATEAYLSAPRGDDAEETRDWRMYLEMLKQKAAGPGKVCHLVSPVTATETPFIKLMSDATHMEAFGLEVKLNSRNARLQIDTGASGLLVTRSVAQRAGLKRFSQTEIGGIGDEGSKAGYTAYADSIRIGNLEFQDCLVSVVDSRNMVGDVDGLIGMDVLSRFLVTLDYPMQKLLLGPLPPRPGETAQALSLMTSEADTDDPGATDEPAGQTGQDKPVAQGAKPGQEPPVAESSASAQAHDSATQSASAHGPYDRYIAPEMKDYTAVYRVGQSLIVPTALNNGNRKLFILDTGAGSTVISPQAAREVAKVRSDAQIQFEGLSGSVNKVYVADEVTFTFGHISRATERVISFDTSKVSKESGMEISGFLGRETLYLLTIRIDYRDGLVWFDYDPHRGYQF
jgi:predicted aspartyl protease